ncbi:MAG: hypothetical protein KDC75_24270 [Phaeodactylibacter sp.]|nr:hypothetical protein [Phaeodactylibacter sp.]
MQNNKLIQVLRALKKEEVRAFGKYIEALYGNYEVALGLFDYLKANHPALQGPKLDKDTVARKLLPPSAENPAKRILNESSRLYKWLEEFLLLEKLREKDNPAREILMAEIFSERQLSHLFYLKVAGFVSACEQKAPADIRDIADALYMQHLWYYYSDPDEGLHTRGQATLRGLMETADSLFLAAKLQYGAELLNRGNLLKEDNLPRLWREAKKEIEQAPHGHGLLQQAFYLAAQLLEEKGLPQYQQLKAFFSDNHHLFSLEVQQILQGYLINHAARRIKQSEYNWIEEALSLYEFGMSTQILFENGLISSIRFINIVNLACHQGKLDWAEAFVEKWSPYLRPGLRPNTQAVAEALILFERGRFGAVRQKVSQCHNQDPLLEARLRALMVMAMVEEKEEEGFILDYCRNYRDYLRRNKVMGENTAEGFSNFVSALMKYIRNSVGPEKLAEEVHAYPYIFCKTWLLHKIGKGEVAR